jgi:hypothetical protein
LFQLSSIKKIIVLKLGPARQVDLRSGAGTGLSWKKNREKKTGCDPVDPVTWQDPVKNPVAIRWFLFLFLLKQYYFDFKKKIDLDFQPDRSKNYEENDPFYNLPFIFVFVIYNLFQLRKRFAFLCVFYFFKFFAVLFLSHSLISPLFCCVSLFEIY